MGWSAIAALVWRRFLRPILTFGITLPVWAFLAGGLWLHFDKTSAVRRAVDKAVTDLVAGEELAAARAETEAVKKIADERARRLAAANRASELFAEKLAESQANQQETQDAIQDLLARPVSGDCTVDGDVLGRLRER